ncbi:MAG: glutaredoxin family protein [Candidatus Woesearchaeota archaeon]
MPIIQAEHVYTDPEVEKYDGEVNFFYSDTCPHCHEEIKFLRVVEEEYPDIKINYFEVSDIENQDLFSSFADCFNSTDQGVPRTFINHQVFVGFDPGNGDLQYSPIYKANIGYKNQIENAIKELALQTNTTNDGQCANPDPANGINDNNNSLGNSYWIFLIVILYLLTYIGLRKKIKNNEQMKRYWISGLIAVIIISLFAFILFVPEAVISDFANNLPFPLFVFVIALADGFNPCAFTVLFILLSLLTYTKRKRDMNLIGVIFIITSAVMYFLFIMIMILLGAFFIEKYGEIILTVLGVIIAFAGLINLKDYLFFKKGVSLSLSDEHKSKITSKVRKIVMSLKDDRGKKALLLAIGATILLAIGVNLVELGCTAILPTVYMSALLTKFGLAFGIQHLIWTTVYAIVYIIPLFAILLNFMFTFKSERVSESQGRILKLIAGVFMFLFGLIMIFKPSLLVFG